MPSCIQIDNIGRVSFTGEPIDQCSGFVLFDGLDYSDYPTLTAIFNVPIQEDLQSLWLLGFSLPLVIYLTSWAFNQVINFISR